MPTSLIPIIARTNTIDEWRIQTNKSATDLNDLGFYTYDKQQGTLLLSNTSVLSITAEGTPLQVANNVLFQSSLTLSNTLFLGVQSSATGNIIAGGTVSVRGPGSALSVSNNSYVGVDLQVVNNVYANNYTANGSVNVANNLTVSTGSLRLNGTGNVAYANNGSFKSNTIYSTDTFSTNVSTANLYAAFGRIDVLDDLAFARIGILENVTGNSYYLASNSHTSNSVSTRYLVANISGNIVNFSSNVSSINTATVLSGNVVTLVSNSASINVATVNTSTTLVGNVVTLTSNSATINVASINTSSINVLSSNNLTSAHRITANNIITNNVEVSTINAAWVNVSSNLWMQSGSQLRIYAPGSQYESLIVGGKTTLNTAYVTSNLTVEGTWTALGDIEYETNEIILNKRTPTNADAIIRNERPVGDDAIIRWVETDDQWKISKGGTYSELFGILDASFLDSQVSNLSTSNVATPLAVNTAHSVAQTSGRYANSAYHHANGAFIWANAMSTLANANSARFTTNITIAGSYANSAYGRANDAYDLAATALEAGGSISGGYANSAFGKANTADQRAVTSGVYANGAYEKANTGARDALSAGVYANAAYETANTSATAAALAQDAAAKVLANVTPAFIHANAGFIFANTANVHLNVAFRHANAAFVNANNAVYRTGGSDTQSINGNITVGGKIESGNIKFNGDTALLQGGTFVFNGNQNQNQGPSLNAIIEVDRGTAANAIFRYNETIDRWEYTHATSDPAVFTTLGFVSERANNITGGALNKILVQTALDTTGFIEAPPVNLAKFLQWTGTAFAWSDVTAPNVTGFIQQDASGLLPTNKVSRTDNTGTRTYPMNITGDAGYATSAGSATTATTATNATNATNVTAGGSVVTGTVGGTTTTSLTNYGASQLTGRVRIVNTTQATVGQDNSGSPASGAALYVEGGIFCEKDVVADTFRGIATSAYYSADLAEYYLPDQHYDYGTIMMIGGNKEVTAATKDKLHVIIGVISEKPAFTMNDGLEGGIIVGLKGRLPVRILGTCKKGDLLEMSDIPGVAKVSDGNKLPLRLICLEDKNTEEEGKIEVAIM